MESATYYSRNKSYGDKIFQSNGKRRPTNYGDKVFSPKPQVKSANRQYNSKPAWYNESSEYGCQFNSKRASQYVSIETNWKQKQSNLKKGNYSPCSTMASEGDYETELSGFKVAQSGKILIDSQSSDSDSIFSPVESTPKKEETRFASATKFLGPNPQDISLPSFL